MRINSENEKLKKKYLDRLRYADGLTDASIVSISRAIYKYDLFSQSEEYRLVSPAKAVAFKQWLLESHSPERLISLTTAYGILRHFRSFIKWLSVESGFKSQSLRESVAYLKLDQNQNREATAPKFVEAPSLEHVKKLVMSIEPTDEVANRNRASISFLFLTGMRDLAVATLPLVCFDRQKLVIHQDPKLGVKTKRRKTIHSKLLPFDTELVQIVLDWYDFLVNVKLFKGTDPLFPQTNLVQASNGFSFEVHGVKPEFWQTASPIRQIVREASLKANLPYFKPHLFRRAAIQQSMPFAKTAEQMKALSQNFGHENIGTTLMTYGMLDTHQVIDIVGKMDFGVVQKGKVDKVQIASMIAYLQSLNDE